jgi:glycosyltransferase involved in cell wall biosynthesis
VVDAALKRVLIVAFQFPPAGGSSGVQRALKFSKYLPEFGWEPLILTATPGAYRVVRGTEGDSGVPADIVVRRGWAVDAGRLIRLGGRHPPLIDLPDRWASWWLTAVPLGLGLIRRYKPKVIFSTFPIATAHLIGRSLSRVAGLPWIADFRDPMIEDDYPKGRLRRGILARLERSIVEESARVISVTSGLRGMFSERYPEQSVAKWQIIPNGFDEEDFQRLERRSGAGDTVVKAGSEIRLVHSGIIYGHERNPAEFFAALGQLVENGELKSGDLKVVLRGSRNEAMCLKMIKRHQLQSYVELAPLTSYEAALREMEDADGLLLLQGANCNRQIPAKLYEYLKVQRPIIALTDPAGETGRLLLHHGIDTIAPLEDRDAIAWTIRDFLSRIKAGGAPIADEKEVNRYSRREGTKTLSSVLDEVMV